jgi:SAM-dependent methyltransferase
MKIILQIPEYIKLFFIAITNILYNAGIFVVELFHFGVKPWWWGLGICYFFSYCFINLNRLIRQESVDAGYPEENFIYGETPCITVREILRVARCGKDSLFIDLGCGRGRTVFYSHFLTGMNARGYDLIPTFIKKSERIRRKMKIENVEFFGKDILKSDVSDADLVYVAGTTFSDDFIKKLNKKLEEMKKDAVIVTLSYPLPPGLFHKFEKRMMFFSWGKSTVYFHRKT